MDKKDLAKLTDSLYEAVLATMDIWVNHKPHLERHAFGCVTGGYDGKNQTLVYFQFETPTMVEEVLLARVTGDVGELHGFKFVTEEFIIPDLGFGEPYTDRNDEFFCKIWHRKDPMELTLHRAADAMRLKRLDVPVYQGPAVFLPMDPAFNMTLMHYTKAAAGGNMLNFCSTTPRRSEPAPYAKTPPEKLAPPVDLDF